MNTAEEAALRQENARLRDSNAALQSEVRRLLTALKAREPKAVTPTPKQRLLLAFIDSYQRSHNGVSPSYQEMADGVGVVSKARIHQLIIGLEERGALQRIPHRARAMTIIATPSHEEPTR